MTSSADIRLRAVEPEDLELMYRIENDPQFWNYGSTTVPYSRYVLRQYLETSRNDLFADGQVRLVIAKGRTSMGFADLTNLDAIHLRAEIGLAVLREYQGQHIGTTAIQCLCEYARRVHLHQIYAIIATVNEPATRLFRSLAFTPSTLLHDWLRTEDGFVDAVVWQKVMGQ